MPLMSDIPTDLRDALQAGTDEAMRALGENDALCFAVDWREEDDAIVGCCEDILSTGQLVLRQPSIRG